MRTETIQDLKASLQDAKIQEREAQDKYETARYRRSVLEATMSIMQGRTSDKR